MKSPSSTLLAVMLLAGSNAYAQVSIHSPSENATLTSRTILKGNCTGSESVTLHGSGFAKPKTISCQKRTLWEYELTNIFKNIPDGVARIHITQSGNQVTRTFIKGNIVSPPPVNNSLKVTFTSPAAGAELTALSVLKGTCKGRADVILSGSSFGDTKSISCRNEKTWEYPLENRASKMKPGNAALTISQNGESSTRIFVKAGVVTNPTPVPEIPPVVIIPAEPEPIPVKPPVTTPPVVKPPVVVPPAPINEDILLETSKAPAQNFNLNLWKLTLPVDANGTRAGKAIEYKPIPAALQIVPYFYTASDGAMVFSAPTDGATTTGSKYPRSELREMNANGSMSAWSVEQGGTLNATLAVNELPVTSNGQTGRVVIGQIHGPADELCRMYYDANGMVSFYDDKAGSAAKETQFILKNAQGATTRIPLGERFSYTIKSTREALTVTVVHDGQTYTAVDPVGPFWPGKALYFKAGVYVQVGKPGSAAGTTGTGQGRVSFYALGQPSHP